MVPAVVAAGQAVRAHLVFRPGERDGHWNNESGPMTVWLDPPDGWRVSRRVVEVTPRAKTAVSVEPRAFMKRIDWCEVLSLDPCLDAVVYPCGGFRTGQEREFSGGQTAQQPWSVC